MSDQNCSTTSHGNGHMSKSRLSQTSLDTPCSSLSQETYPQNAENFTLSGKFWGRVKKFLLCKSGFPSGVCYIVGSEFCERFSYCGMKAILILYLTRVLALGDDTATAVFHSFLMLCYFTPLFGAMIADGWLGKYRTIQFVFLLYGVGSLIVFVTSLPPLGAGEIPGPMIGLFLIALATGGIKPCVSSFGGDQFTSDQTHLLQSFVSVLYFAMNAGSLLSTFITPVLRGDVKCFKDDCYPLAFGLPTVFLMIAVAIFWCGRHKYKNVPQTGNIIWKVTKVISYALKKKITTKGESKEHWMDWAGDTYDAQLIQDIKGLCKVLFMFLPLPVFWTLFDQQGSRWVLQAQQMDGYAGFLGTFKPDQMQAFNALFIILLIPLFEGVLYPLFKRPTPLKRMCAGMFLACVAFVFAGFLQMKIQSEEMVKDAPPSGQANLQVINTLQCPVTLTLENKNITIDPLDKSSEQHLSVKQNVTLMITSPADCKHLSKLSLSYQPDLKEHEWYNFVIGGVGNRLIGHMVKQNITPAPPHGRAKLCTLLFSLPPDDNSFDVLLDKHRVQENVLVLGKAVCIVLSADHYRMTVVGRKSSKVYASSEVLLKNGGIYTAVVQENKKDYANPAEVLLFKDLDARNVSMLYQIPQYFVITSGEILFSITGQCLEFSSVVVDLLIFLIVFILQSSGLEFAYSQTPANMKSCLHAAWLMTVAFGNLIVVIEAESHLFGSLMMEFFFFAAMIFVIMLVFMMMSTFYYYLETPAAVEPIVLVPVDRTEDRMGIGKMHKLAKI